MGSFIVEGSLVFSLFFFTTFSLSTRFRTGALIIRSTSATAFALSVNKAMVGGIPTAGIIIRRMCNRSTGIAVHFASPGCTPVRNGRVSVIHIGGGGRGFTPAYCETGCIIGTGGKHSGLGVRSVISGV